MNSSVFFYKAAPEFLSQNPILYFPYSTAGEPLSSQFYFLTCQVFICLFQTTVLTYVEFNFSEKIKSEQVQSHLKLIFLTDLCPLEEEPHGLCIRRKLKLRIGEERTFFSFSS